MREHLMACLIAALGLTSAAAQATRTWLFDDSSDMATLQYGTPESDDVVIAFSCEAGSKRMRITEFASSSGLTPGQAARLKLAGGGASLEYPGEAVGNEMDGGVNLEIVVAPDPRLFTLLKGGGSLAIEVAGKQASVPLKAAVPHVPALEKTCLAKR